MPIENGKYVNPGWVNGTSPAMNATEMNAISNTLALVPIANGGTGGATVAAARKNLGLGNTSGAVPLANGGTGATTAAQARANLGITPANIGAVSTSGGTINGDITINGTLNATGFDTDTIIPVANGGTGVTTLAGIRNALGLGNTTGAVPIANGGTGATTVEGARNALGLGNTAGALPVANGGTGQTTTQATLTSLLNGNRMYLTSTSYGNNLPSTGSLGQLFFKKL